jgi:D-inositol-3-phosphate glycosyltransferase
MMRVLMVEPQGEGGISHYAYCLGGALRDLDCDVTLATGHPYELAFARPTYAVAPLFGYTGMRRIVQRQLGRIGVQPDTRLATPLPGRRQDAALMRLGRVAVAPPHPVRGVAGKASRWLAHREYRSGWRRTLGLAARHGPAIAHVQWISWPEHDARWLHTLRGRGVRVVLTVHNVLPHDASASARLIWPHIYRAADRLIVHYPDARDDLGALGVDLARVSVIPHGNYLPIAALVRAGASGEQGAPAHPQAQARARLGLPLDAPIVLFFGMMRPYKGIDHLLEAFVQVHAALPTARLLLVGRAPHGFARYEQRLTELGIADAVTAVPRYLPLGEVGHWFAASDLVVLPYAEASQSGVIQLAYAFKRPVIATWVGGLPDAVLDGVTGLLVPPCDGAALAESIARMLRDRGRCALWGERAYDLARDRFSWDRIAAQTAQVYEQAMSEPLGDIGDTRPRSSSRAVATQTRAGRSDTGA